MNAERRTSNVGPPILLWLGMFLAVALMVILMPMWVLAEEAQSDERRKPGLDITAAGFTINGKFDLNYEKGQFTGSPSEGTQSIKNYHHFVFLGRNKREEPVFLNVELVDLTFYEMGVKLGGHRTVRFGKLYVPFGADPIFHHTYGGLSGFDQKLVPPIWTELGAAYRYDVILKKTYRVQNEIAIVSGLKADKADALKINGQGDAGRPAIVDRFGGGWWRYSAWASFYWDQYLSDNNLFMWGGDIYAGYGFLPWPWLENLQAKVGFVRADVQNKTGPNYYHFGDYIQLDYRLPFDLRFRYRGGLTTTDNHKGLFFDSEREDTNDRIGHNVGLWWEYKLLTVGAEYFVNVERASEEANDLIRASAILEF